LNVPRAQGLPNLHPDGGGISSEDAASPRHSEKPEAATGVLEIAVYPS